MKKKKDVPGRVCLDSFKIRTTGSRINLDVQQIDFCAAGNVLELNLKKRGLFNKDCTSPLILQMWELRIFRLYHCQHSPQKSQTILVIMFQ